MIDKNVIIAEVPDSMKAFEAEFYGFIEKGYADLRNFAYQYGLSQFMGTNLIKRAILLESKNNFDDMIRMSSNLPPESTIPNSFIAAAEADVLWILPPTEVARLNPRDAQDPNYYSKLIAHELGHILHIRTLNGKEDDMGPVWFYEGFAVVAANQFEDFTWPEYDQEYEQIIRCPDRGNYRKYGVILRNLLKEHSMERLLNRAKDYDFNEWAISSLRNG